jgi:radical SAM superfamily enzyme YgiQ (UPF0313 family)
MKILVKTGLSVTWSGFVRAAPELASDSYVKRLANSGCRMLQIGMETPDQRLLDSMNKGINATLFADIIHNLKQHHIRSYVYMLFGYPGQSISSCEDTLTFLEKTKPDYLNTAIFRWYPDAPITRQFHQSSSIHSNHTRKLKQDDSNSIARPELRRWISTRLQNSVTVRRIIKNTPHHYKSNHAVYF